MNKSHFKGQSVEQHLREKRLQGVISREPHGSSPTASFFAMIYSVKESAILALLLWTALIEIDMSIGQSLFVLATIGGGWVLWRGCIAAFRAWSRMEKIYRIIEQEKYEIEHNLEEEREELKEIYRAKGFEGQLLDNVTDVLMADEDRLLRVMLEEEFGVTLESQEHPLKIGLASGLGALLTAAFLTLSFMSSALYGIPLMVTLLLILSEVTLSSLEKKKILPSIVWLLAIAAITIGFSHFLVIWLQSFTVFQ